MYTLTGEWWWVSEVSLVCLVYYLYSLCYCNVYTYLNFSFFLIDSPFLLLPENFGSFTNKISHHHHHHLQLGEKELAIRGGYIWKGNACANLFFYQVFFSVGYILLHMMMIENVENRDEMISMSMTWAWLCGVSISLSPSPTNGADLMIKKIQFLLVIEIPLLFILASQTFPSYYFTEVCMHTTNQKAHHHLL